jgi:hypothetical protein
MQWSGEQQQERRLSRSSESEDSMSAGRWEYKVVYVEGWHRISVEGQETHTEERERNSAFGRRVLNGLGADGWDLVGIQHARPGSAYYIFKRPLADGAEPDLSVVRHEAAEQPNTPEQPAGPDGSQAVSL